MRCSKGLEGLSRIRALFWGDPGGKHGSHLAVWGTGFAIVFVLFFEAVFQHGFGTVFHDFGIIFARLLTSFCYHFCVFKGVVKHGFGVIFITFLTTFQKQKSMISLIGVSEITFSRYPKKDTNMI
jgi:hypothetical protein